MLLSRAVPRIEDVRKERKSLAESKWVKVSRRKDIQGEQ